MQGLGPRFTVRKRLVASSVCVCEPSWSLDVGVPGLKCRPEDSTLFGVGWFYTPPRPVRTADLGGLKIRSEGRV